MPPEQKDLEQAIGNIDKIVADFQCSRQARRIIETSWQLIIESARIPAPVKPVKSKDKPEKPAP